LKREARAGEKSGGRKIKKKKPRGLSPENRKEIEGARQGQSKVSGPVNGGQKRGRRSAHDAATYVGITTRKKPE